jgi:branched-chain amino acid aminotransferase
MEYWKAQPTGKNQVADLEPVSALPAEAENPSTVYTTLRTYHRSDGTARYLYLEKHIERLNNSLSFEGSGQQVDPVVLTSLLKAVEKNSRINGDLRIKILVVPQNMVEVYFSVEPFSSPDPAAYRDGVQVLTTHFMRQNPKAKMYSFVDEQARIRSQMRQEAEEILMVNDRQEILEGLSSNFFGIIRNELFTAAEGVLNGITGQIIVDLVQRNGIKLTFKPVTLNEVDQLTECFITSTSRGVLPVTRIEQLTIGKGSPGPVTLRLMTLFESEIESLIKPI